MKSYCKMTRFIILFRCLCAAPRDSLEKFRVKSCFETTSVTLILTKFTLDYYKLKILKTTGKILKQEKHYAFITYKTRMSKCCFQFFFMISLTVNAVIKKKEKSKQFFSMF